MPVSTLAERMVGQRVTHVSLGVGTVTRCSNIAIRIKMDAEGSERSFAFPYSFKQFLRAEDPVLQTEIVEFYDSGCWTEPIHCHDDEKIDK